MSQINFVTICLPQRLLLCLLGFNYIFTIILRVKKTQWCRYVVQGLSGLLFTTPGPGFKLKYWNIWKGNSSLDWKDLWLDSSQAINFCPLIFTEEKHDLGDLLAITHIYQKSFCYDGNYVKKIPQNLTVFIC